MNTATTAAEKSAICAPLTPAANEQRFVVSIKREGRSTLREVWANDWFSAWVDAYDAHGPGCKIEVRPCVVSA